MSLLSESALYLYIMRSPRTRGKDYTLGSLGALDSCDPKYGLRVSLRALVAEILDNLPFLNQISLNYRSRAMPYSATLRRD